MPVNEIKDQQQQEQPLKPEKMFDDHSSGSSSGVSEDEEHEIDSLVKKTSNQNQKMGEKFLSLPSRSHEKFLRTLFDNVLNNAVFEGTKRENKVLEWTDPEELAKKFDMSLKDEADSDEELLKLANDTIKYSVKTGHPYFVNQLFSCVDPYGFAGQVITDALNPSVYTYEVSPCFILMEEVVLKEMRSIVGYPNGDGDGIFCPGGSAANGYAISCARYRAFPDVKVMMTFCQFTWIQKKREKINEWACIVKALQSMFEAIAKNAIAREGKYFREDFPREFSISQHMKWNRKDFRWTL